MLLSSLADASHLPSELKARDSIVQVWAGRFQSSLPVAGSHIKICPCSWAAARRLLSLVMANFLASLLTTLVCSRRVRSSRPVTASQIFTVLSLLAEASQSPLRLKARSLTLVGAMKLLRSAWPHQVRGPWPPATSHSRTRLSSQTEATRQLS